MRNKKLSPTQERINALRITQNRSFQDIADALSVPVYAVKRWCGYRLTFSEWLNSKFDAVAGGRKWML